MFAASYGFLSNDPQGFGHEYMAGGERMSTKPFQPVPACFRVRRDSLTTREAATHADS